MSLINSMPPLTAVTYAALLLSVFALWFGRYTWAVVLVVAVVAGYASGVLHGPGALWIVLFGALCIAYSRAKLLASAGKRRTLMILSAVGILIVALLLGLHVLPGFRNFLALDDVVLSAGAAPYTLYLNIDKTIVGLCLVGLCYRSLLASWKEWASALGRAGALMAIGTLAVALFAMALGYLEWQPKWTPVFWIWATSNLFFTCLSEEALFRGFIQRELAQAFQGKPYATWLPIAASALLFGAAHFAGGWSYVALATAAGLGYALVYHRTQSLEMAMLGHFALNATHFLLFTYPRAG